MPYGNLNVDTVTTSTQGGVLGAGNASIMKNRIINGSMVIDQRNAGASVTANDSVFPVDRFFYYAYVNGKGTLQQNAGSVTTPAGFKNYLGFTSTSAYSIAAGESLTICQKIEGFNTADLNFGTANAKTITVSALVYSSLTGTFGGSVQNSARNRSYPFSYTISTANTWTQISVTIAGDTSGTWIGATNGVGMYLHFSVGAGATYSGTAGAWAGADYQSATGATSVVGTNGATFYLTAVQLEVGSSGTGYEYRLYNQELLACQRYYQQLNENPSTLGILGFVDATTSLLTYYYLPVSMRTAPTFGTSGTASDYSVRSSASTVTACSVVPTGTASDANRIRIIATVTAGLVAGQGAALVGNTTSGILNFSAEL